MSTLANFEATAINGTPVNLADFQGKVVLVVNTASKCGLTPQFAGLQALYEEFHDAGLEILGFPCSQFAHQEFDDAESTASFCQREYGVSFQMFEKIDVNGRKAHPLFKWLKKSAPGTLGGPIAWNFTKFLVGADGAVLARFSPQAEPASLKAAIQDALARA